MAGVGFGLIGRLNVRARLSPLPPVLMSVQRLSELPVEILEKTFLCLPGQDIIKLEAVRRIFSDSGTKLRF